MYPDIAAILFSEDFWNILELTPGLSQEWFPTNIVAVCLLTNYTIGEQNGNGGMLISFHLPSMSNP
jgi:hypothetical protein